MNDAPSAPTFLEPAPGARAAKLCGIWSLVLSFTCVCLPIGFVLAIIALVQQAKAKRMAKEHPDYYETPTATGLVTGIIGLAMPVLMLPFIGIVSAIAIPAMLSQRGRARDKAAIEIMISRTGDLVGQWDNQRTANTPPEQMPQALETYLREHANADRNPWNLAQPAYEAHIEVVSNLDREELEQFSTTEAAELGRPVWVLELPQANRPGFIGGAVRTQNAIHGSFVVTKVVEIE